VPILPTAPSPLLATQRELVVVSTFAVGLHYVMRRHDGTYMDPADGGDHRSFDALNTWDKCYQTTGLSFVITTNEVDGDDLRRLFSD
jgi:hypothetical protein